MFDFAAILELFSILTDKEKERVLSYSWKNGTKFGFLKPVTFTRFYV